MSPHTATAPAAAAAVFVAPGGWWHGVRYGALGFPLAFVALPLYVMLPNHYATTLGVSLAGLGAVLLAARLLDAVVDPWIGRVCDGWFGRGHTQVLGWGAAMAVVLGLGLWALLFPPAAVLAAGHGAVLAWLCAMLVVASLAYSVLSVAHQAWGARLGGNEAERSRVVAWREGAGLMGVVCASVLPVALGLSVSTSVFGVSLLLGWALWRQAVRPLVPTAATHSAAPVSARPLRERRFVRLLLVFLVNGTASALPATLVLFFVQDRLQASAAWQPAFLGSYCVCAAWGIPLWLRLVQRVGLVRSWACGMLLAVAVFVWALAVGPGDEWLFLLICALGGVALGADLALPGALLAGLIGAIGQRGQGEGVYFGWWSLVNKLNLALAAGLTLPLLAAWGYTPGSRDPQALQALTWVYCGAPCVLKLLATGLLWRWLRHDPAFSSDTDSHTRP